MQVRWLRIRPQVWKACAYGETLIIQGSASARNTQRNPKYRCYIGKRLIGWGQTLADARIILLNYATPTTTS